MTEPDTTAERRAVADALAHAVERRYEVLDAVVASDDYDAAIDAIADLLDASAAAAEAVLRLSFYRLTKVSRGRIAADLENLSKELTFTSVEQTVRSARRVTLRPFASDADRDIFAARTTDMRSKGDGTAAPAGDLGEEIRDAVERVAAEEAAWLVAEVGSAGAGSTKIGMVFGELSDGEVEVRIWIHPDHRKQGYGTAALLTSRSELAAFFPAAPLVVRTPAARP